MIKIDFSKDQIIEIGGSSAQLKADLTVALCAIAKQLGVSQIKLLETLKQCVESNPNLMHGLVTEFKE